MAEFSFCFSHLAAYVLLLPLPCSVIVCVSLYPWFSEVSFLYKSEPILLNTFNLNMCTVSQLQCIYMVFRQRRS